MPETTVVIPCYNANETLGLQLESLAHQINAPDFDVIVVDNASPMNPHLVVDNYLGRLNIRIITARDAQGVAYARNVGLGATASEYVVFLDADDCAGSGFVAAAVEALRSASFVTGNVFTFEPQVFSGGLNEVWSQLAQACDNDGDIFNPDINVSYPIFMGGASAVRRADALAIGGFDQSYVPGAEDNDFGIRAVRAGYFVQRCSAMVLAERRRATSNQVFKRAYAGGLMHMRLCAGHDLWAVSPHLHEPEWWVDLIKLPVTGLKAVISRQDPNGLRNWAGRAGLRLGQGAGFVMYKVMHRPIQTETGLGLMRMAPS